MIFGSDRENGEIPPFGGKGHPDIKSNCISLKIHTKQVVFEYNEK